MRTLFCILMTCILMYTTFKKRDFDYLTISSFSAFLYYYPGFFGKLILTNSNNSITIDDRTYLCINIFLFILLFVMIICDKYKIRNGLYKKKNNESNEKTCLCREYNNAYANFTILLVGILGLFLMLYTVTQYGNIGTGFNKAHLLMSSGRITEYMKYITLFVFIYSFICKGKYIKLCKIISLILISYTFILGHRSFIVIGLIAIFMHNIRSNGKIRLKDVFLKNKKKFLLIFIAAFFFFFIKNVFAALMAGNYELVKLRLSDPEYYMNSILRSESNTIMLNLNNVITTNLRYDFGNYLIGFLSLIPVLGKEIMNSMNYVTFETQLNMLFNSDFNNGIGLGSTFLGETYSIGGPLFLIFLIVLILIFIVFFMKKLKYIKSPFIYTFISIALTYFCFYIHRNSLIFLFSTLRAYIYILLLAIIIYVILINGSKAKFKGGVIYEK